MIEAELGATDKRPDRFSTGLCARLPTVDAHSSGHGLSSSHGHPAEVEGRLVRRPPHAVRLPVGVTGSIVPAGAGGALQAAQLWTTR